MQVDLSEMTGSSWRARARVAARQYGRRIGLSLYNTHRHIVNNSQQLNAVYVMQFC
jgi:hypothetical protein